MRAESRLKTLVALAAAAACLPLQSQTLYPRAPADPAPSQVLAAGDYAANAAVARIVVEVDRNGVPADGQSPVQVGVKLFDKEGQPLKGTAFATVETSGGRVLLPGARTDELGPRRQDADRVTPGIQLKVVDGRAAFTLLAPAEAQDVRLRVTAGAEEAQGTVAFVPELRPMVAAGLVEGVISFRNKTRLDPVRSNDGFEQEIQSWARQFDSGKANAAARTAFFLKGTIKGDALLTAAYDSDKDVRARLLRDVRPDEFYPVYGDSALRTFDARSGSRLFVRIDQGRDYALYGDFITGDGFTQVIGQGNVASLKARSLGNYNRTATGVRAHHEDDGAIVNAFVFNDTLKQVVEEFASQGSGPYGLRNNAVVEGSEKVEVLVRDRNQPSRILSVRPLVRLVDYTFEPFSGRILLTSFLASVDENLNPISLRVTYELDQGGEAFWVGGVDGQVKVGGGVEVGGSAVEDRNPLSPYKLYSGNATWQMGPKTVLVVEGAETRSTVNTNPTNQTATPGLADRTGEVSGKAARIEFAHEGESADARVFAGRSSPLFDNPAAPLQGGRDELYAKGGIKLRDDLKLYGEGLKSADRNEGGGSRSQAGAGLRWNASERLTLDVGVRDLRETIGTQGNGLLTWPYDQTQGLTGSIASGAGGGALGFGNQTLDPATGLPVVVQGGLQPAAASSLPVGTRLESRTLRLGAGYKASERLRFGAEVEGDVSGEQRRRESLGADYTVAERTKLYGRYEHQSGWVQLGGVSDVDRSANAFVFGIDTSYWHDTQLFSEYRLRDAVAGRDLQLASGVRRSWDVAEGVRVDAGYEQLNVVSGDTAPVKAVTVGLDYSASALWRAGTRIEVRRSGDVPGTADDDRFDTTLWQAMVARKLDRDWTLLGRNYLLATNYAARGDVLQDRAQVGVAYRDTDTNRVNALAKVEYKLESDASNAAVGTLRSRAWIVSAHADWHPSRPWWMTGRVAGKWQDDRFENGVSDAFRAQLVAGRLVYDITERWDVGVLLAGQFGQHGAAQTAYGAEVGYLLRQNLWLSAGVNRAGFAGDADLTGYEYTRRGAYVRLRFKFDEDLFKGRDPEVNRSLPR